MELVVWDEMVHKMEFRRDDERHFDCRLNGDLRSLRNGGLRWCRGSLWCDRCSRGLLRQRCLVDGQLGCWVDRGSFFSVVWRDFKRQLMYRFMDMWEYFQRLMYHGCRFAHYGCRWWFVLGYGNKPPLWLRQITQTKQVGSRKFMLVILSTDKIHDLRVSVPGTGGARLIQNLSSSADVIASMVVDIEAVSFQTLWTIA